ncbi:MAG: zinc ribbon domain-containing protein [Firmicutes bacterium]|nr:zinc ribbon domain-containing protein [Bacillota bacterium]
MPVYDFRCKKCEHRFTVFTGMSERDKVTCPECKAGEIEQLITGCMVRSGSGCSPKINSGGSGFRGG